MIDFEKEADLVFKQLCGFPSTFYIEEWGRSIAARVEEETIRRILSQINCTETFLPIKRLHALLPSPKPQDSKEEKK